MREHQISNGADRFMNRRFEILVAALALLVVASSNFVLAQERDRNRKPDTTQKAMVPGNEPASKEDKDKEAKSEGDPVFRGMKYRSIGPFRGGRALTAAGIPGDATTYYFGATGGGVWKSTDGANSWTPVFDHDGSPAIGSLAVAGSDPNVIYVGTGEGCIRGNIAQGDGVWKSVDAGKTWKNAGPGRFAGDWESNCESAECEYRVCGGARPSLWAECGAWDFPHCGRRQDVGKSSLQGREYGRDRCGVRSAKPEYSVCGAMGGAKDAVVAFESGGPGSGIYRSNDGGATWKHLEEHGLPKGPYGRMGVAVAANSERVYALIEAKENGGLYRSDDGGDSWDLVNGNHGLYQRAWYYMHVIADPQDANTVYVADVEFFKSTDGGRTL